MDNKRVISVAEGFNNQHRTIDIYFFGSGNKINQ